MSQRTGNRDRSARKGALLRMQMLGAMGALALLAGCHNDMWIQPKVKPYDPSDFFPNGQGMRQLPAHTVDRTHYWSDTARYLGYEGGHWVNGTYIGGKMVEQFPIKITKADILRGQERFTIYCSPCHGALGNGQGMIANRGLTLRRQPGNYQTDRLRKMPIGHFYDVITNGYGVMYSYAARVEPDDRWRIAAYIRVLQRSQNARPGDVPAGQMLIVAPSASPTPAAGEVGTTTTPAGDIGATSGGTTPPANGTNANGH